MNTFTANKQQGITLIELMIALALGTVLLAGIISIYTASIQSYRLLEDLSQVQENGRFAMGFITEDVLNISLDCHKHVDVLNGPSDSHDQISLCNEGKYINYSLSLGKGEELALFKKNGTANQQALVEGIYDLQILYGVDAGTDSDCAVNYYDNAGTYGTSDGKIRSLHITLSAQAVNSTSEQEGLKKVFSSTIAIDTMITRCNALTELNALINFVLNR